MDPLEPGRLLVSMDRDSAPEVEAHGEGHIPAGQATVDQGNADRARHPRLWHSRAGGGGRGRDEDLSSPPAQIPAGAANAPGSHLG